MREASLRELPPQLRLPVAVTCYWLRTAQPRPDQRVVTALLLGLSSGDALRQRAGRWRHSSSSNLPAEGETLHDAGLLLLLFEEYL